MFRTFKLKIAGETSLLWIKIVFDLQPKIFWNIVLKAFNAFKYSPNNIKILEYKIIHM